jgi:hypothetical protein
MLYHLGWIKYEYNNIQTKRMNGKMEAEYEPKASIVKGQ